MPTEVKTEDLVKNLANSVNAVFKRIQELQDHIEQLGPLPTTIEKLQEDRKRLVASTNEERDKQAQEISKLREALAERDQQLAKAQEQIATMEGHPDVLASRLQRLEEQEQSHQRELEAVSQAKSQLSERLAAMKPSEESVCPLCGNVIQKGETHGVGLCP